MPLESDAPLDRLARAVRLDGDVFEQIGGDERATGAALVLVLVAAGLEGVGSPSGWLLGSAGAALRWLLCLGAIHLGARALGLSNRLSPLFRGLAFAAAPFALGVFEALPLVGGLVWVVKWIWAGAAYTVATSRTLETETPVAAALCVAGLVVAVLLAHLVL